MNNIIKRKWNQNSMVIIEDLQGMAFQAESGGHTFQISGIDGEGNTVSLSGTPAGVMLRADGQDVALTCSVSGGVVSATLPANAYSVPGRFGLTIFLTSNGQKTAIYAAAGTVGKTSSGTVAPPAGSDVVDLVNRISAAIAAIPASYNSCFAPAYSTSGLYSVGQYVTYDGKLYRCNTAITTAETWTAAHWTQTNLGADVYDLKSAISGKDIAQKSAYSETNVFPSTLTNQRIKVSDGSIVDATNQKLTDYIPVQYGQHLELNFYVNSTSYGNAFFDANKQIIMPVIPGNAASRHIDVPVNAAYFRATIASTDAETATIYITAPWFEDIKENSEAIEAIETFNGSVLVDAASFMTEIEENTDLDDISVPGTYKSISGEVTATLTNIPPIDSEFSMVVINSGLSGYICQILYPATSGAIYSRSYRGSTWRAWNKYTAHDIDQLYNSIKDSIVGKNLLDGIGIETGRRVKISDGGTNSAGSMSISRYIPVCPGMIVYTNFVINSDIYGNVFYDKNYTPIVPGYAGTEENIVMHVPNNAFYLRVTFPTTMENTAEVRYAINSTDIAYEKTKWLAMGDSITFGVYSYVSGDSSEKGETVNRWVSLLAKSMGYQQKVMASRGMGYSAQVTGQDPDNPGGSRISLDSLLTRVEALTDDFNMITLAYGINDYATSSATIQTVLAGFDDAVQRLMAKWPEARLVVITPFNSCRQGDASTNYAYNSPLTDGSTVLAERTLKDIADAIKERCASYGIECIYATNGFLLNNYNIHTLLPDDTHPSLTGHKLIAKNMAHYLLN